MPIALIHSPAENIVLPAYQNSGLPSLIRDFQDHRAQVQYCPAGFDENITPPHWSAEIGARFFLKVTEEDSETGWVTAMVQPDSPYNLSMVYKSDERQDLPPSKEGLVSQVHDSFTEIAYRPPVLPLMRHIGALVLHVTPDAMDLLVDQLFPPR